MKLEYFAETSVILIYGHEPKIVAHLRAKVAALAAEQTQTFAIHELPGFCSIDSCKVFASREDSDFGISRLRELNAFECRLKSSTWHNIEDSLEHFTDGSYFGASHQFLVGHGKIKLVISGGRGW